MLNVMKFLVIIFIAVSVQAAEQDSMENTFNCYADYLKRHRLLEQNFQSEPFNGEAVLCDNLLTTTSEGIYIDLIDKFSQVNETKDSVGCIVENLRELKWSDLEIKERIIEFSDSLSDEEMSKNFREIKTIQGRISSDAILKCLAEKEFGELFEQIFKEDEQEDFVADYCARSFALKKKLLDTAKYQVNPNPNNVITNDVKCDEINKKYFAEAEEELKQSLLKDFGGKAEKVDCLIEKYRDLQYFDRTLTVALMGEIKISDDQKQVEKNNFVQVMIKIQKTLENC